MASHDKVAFITGANKGIGLETARGLGGLGIALVLVLGSREEALALQPDLPRLIVLE